MAITFFILHDYYYTKILQKYQFCFCQEFKLLLLGCHIYFMLNNSFLKLL